MLNDVHCSLRHASRAANCRIFSAYRLHVAGERRRTCRQRGHFAMHLFDFHKSSKAACAAASWRWRCWSRRAAAQAPAADVTGLWIDHTGQGAVEIAPCGDRICGRVVWLKNPSHKSKSGKLICGTQILGDLQRQPSNAWERAGSTIPRTRSASAPRCKLTNANTLLGDRLPRHQAARRDIHLEALDRDRWSAARPAIGRPSSDRAGQPWRAPVRNHSTATPLATLVALSALAATVVSTQLTNRSVRSATRWRC